jgi:hypothetical protein
VRAGTPRQLKLSARVAVVTVIDGVLSDSAARALEGGDSRVGVDASLTR